MLEWTNAPLRAADALMTPLNEGASCIDEPPETPAHIFALRAFKTAIFGTPHPKARYVRPQSTIIEKPGQDEEGNSSIAANDEDMKSKNLAQESNHSPKKAAEPIASPAKGILLTPGAGTSRKKNVSFLQYEAKPEDESAYEASFVVREVEQDDSPSKRTHRRETRPGPTAFTKTLIEMSKQRANEHLNLVDDKFALSHKAAPKILAKKDASEDDPDQTIDLAKPRSRSGQHWKDQYEIYYLRSDQEMRNIIKYGQNVKSFAVKRDSEASSLAEQLHKESTRVKEMEAKIHRLTKKLSIAQEQDTKPASYHARLISELAQQTALASKYKQDVDQYQKALEHQPAKQMAVSIVHENARTRDEHHDQLGETQQANMRDQLEFLQCSANDAESKVDKLQEENVALKRSLARVKAEMTSYDSRRQAREERLRNRMEKHKVEKDSAEAELFQLRKDYQQLLLKSALTAENVVPSTHQQLREAHKKEGLNNATSEHATPRRRAAPGVKITSISPRKRRQRPAIDIWTSQSPDAGQIVDLARPNKEQMDLGPSSVKQDISKALKEIDLNLATSEKPPIALVSPKVQDDVLPHGSHREPIGDEDEVPIYPPSTSRRASMEFNVPASSPAKLAPTKESLDIEIRRLRSFRATSGRSASMISAIAGQRLGSMASARSGTPMTTEREAAAKARLAGKHADKRRASQATHR